MTSNGLVCAHRKSVGQSLWIIHTMSASWMINSEGNDARMHTIEVEIISGVLFAFFQLLQKNFVGSCWCRWCHWQHI